MGLQFWERGKFPPSPIWDWWNGKNEVWYFLAFSAVLLVVVALGFYLYTLHLWKTLSMLSIWVKDFFVKVGQFLWAT